MRNKLYKILIIHILVQLFQLLFRQVIFDTTFVRDIGIFVMCAIYVSNKSKDKITASGSIVSLIKTYLIYGLFMVFMHIVMGEDTMSSILLYRNHFFPFVIFFFALYIMRDISYRKRWVNFLYVLFLLFLLDIYAEKLMEMNGISRSILPWYQYQFAHYYRFSTAPNAIPGACPPEFAPTLGFLGYTNPSSCAFTGLFLFLLPFLILSNKTEQGQPHVVYLSKLKKNSLIALSLGAIVILDVKTPFIALLLSFIFITSVAVKVSFNNIKRIISVFLVILIIGYFTSGLWGEQIDILHEETFSSGEMDYILDMALISNLFNAAIDKSVIGLLTGVNLTDNSLFLNLEIRFIVFTFSLGLIWTIIFSLICISTYKVYKKLINNFRNYCNFDILLAIGCFLLFVNYVVDIFHYAHVLYYFHLDIFAVSLAILVAIYKSNDNYEYYK